jgi:hypothetical protein
MFTGLSYRSLRVVYKADRPLITGHPSGLGIQGRSKGYQSLFTDPP